MQWRWANVIVASALLAAGTGAANPPASGYHLLKTYSLPDAPGATREYFDYLTADSAQRRIYVSHGNVVDVMDADNGKLLGTIGGLKLCHGVALAHDFGHGFITDGVAGTVTMFDLKTLKTLTVAQAAPDADSIVYDPASKHVFSMNGDSMSSTVIDAQSGHVVKTIDLGGAPEFAVADGRGTIYVNIESKDEIAAIDTSSMAIKSRWPIAPAGGPTALAIDAQHHRLFSSGRKPAVMVMVNTDTGKVVQSFPISAGVDANRYDARTGMIFASTFAGDLHIFHEDSPDKFSAVATVKTQMGAKTMALDTKTQDIFLDTADFGPPPAPTAARPNLRPVAKLGSFRVLVYGR